jgi:chromosome partitioning protein
MYDGRTNLSRQVAEEVRSHFPNTFRAVIPRSVRVSEAPSHGLPMLAYDRASRAAKAYEALADEVMTALGRVQPEERSDGKR